MSGQFREIKIRMKTKLPYNNLFFMESLLLQSDFNIVILDSFYILLYMGILKSA